MERVGEAWRVDLFPRAAIKTLPQTWQLEATEIYSLTVLEAKSPKSKYHRLSGLNHRSSLSYSLKAKVQDQDASRAGSW